MMVAVEDPDGVPEWAPVNAIRHINPIKQI
jgi:hypothetical protein